MACVDIHGMSVTLTLVDQLSLAGKKRSADEDLVVVGGLRPQARPAPPARSGFLFLPPRLHRDDGGAGLPCRGGGSAGCRGRRRRHSGARGFVCRGAGLLHHLLVHRC
ncbi:hypothetical protein VPH35_072357 [Triticum aestivum]